MFGIGELIVSAATALASPSKPKVGVRAEPGLKPGNASGPADAAANAASKLATSGHIGRSLHTTA